jgi:hypothetical protein
MHKDILELDCLTQSKQVLQNRAVHGNAVTCHSLRNFNRILNDCLLALRSERMLRCLVCECGFCFSEIGPSRHKVHLDGSTAT